MAALEGFELATATANLNYAAGTVDGVAIANGATTPTKAAANTAKGYIYLNYSNAFTTVKGADAASPVLPSIPADAKVVLGSYTVSTTNVTAVSYEGRGANGYRPMQDPLFY